MHRWRSNLRVTVEERLDALDKGLRIHIFGLLTVPPPGRPAPALPPSEGDLSFFKRQERAVLGCGLDAERPDAGMCVRGGGRTVLVNLAMPVETRVAIPADNLSQIFSVLRCGPDDIYAIDELAGRFGAELLDCDLPVSFVL